MPLPSPHAALALGLVLCELLLPRPIWAACNLIPSASKLFRSTLGATDRPFAAPGELVEVAVDPARCDAASAGLLPTAPEHVVSVVFTPATANARRMVVLSPTGCATPAVQSQLAACQMAVGILPTCRSLQPSDLSLVVREGRPRLVFRFPDTDADFSAPADARGLTGPAAIAVTRAGDPLPCGLLVDGATCNGQAGTRACVDRFFDSDGTCRPNPDAVFPQFTALPAANEYQADCFRDVPPCTASATEARAAVDAAGNLLLPVHWHGVLSQRYGIPVPRILHATLKPPVPFTIPNQAFVASFTPEGQRLPPIFEPTVDPTLPPGVLGLAGSVDAPYTVLRIARRFGICQGGDNAGTACTVDRDCFGGTCPLACVGGASPGALCSTNAQCPGGGTCGLLYPDFGPATAGGPFVATRAAPAFCQLPPHAACSAPSECPAPGDTCVTYAFEARTPIPLESLTACSGSSCGFTALESVDLIDRNGDGDTLDAVATLRPRATFVQQALGAPDGFAPGGAPLPGCGILGTPEGRALVEWFDGSFLVESAATRGNVLAFLESEAGENGCDENGDLDPDDAVLRVFTLGPNEATAGFSPAHVVDTGPAIDHRNVAISGGLVFARRSERGQARNLTARLSVATGGSQATGDSSAPSVTADGRVVAFVSSAADLVAGDGNGVRDAFVRDRGTGVTERVSLAAGGGDPDDFSDTALISADGRFVVFTSGATNLVVGDGNGASDVFLRDRQLGTTARVSNGLAGAEPDGASALRAISPDGNVIVFSSTATNLVAGDANGVGDLFLYDRQASTTERVSVTTDGAEATPGQLSAASVTGDGRRIYFSTDGALDGNDPGAFDIYVYDRGTARTRMVTSGYGGDSDHPQVTPDGRYLAYVQETYVYVRDLETRFDTLVNGETGGANFARPAISADGRRVAFLSPEPTLVAGDGNNATDVFLWDRLLATTTRVSVTTEGAETGTSGASLTNVAMSANGGVVVFDDSAGDVVPGDTNNGVDVFARTGDPIDTASDVTGDGDFTDDVLEVTDPGVPSFRLICPASEVVTAGGAAAFVRPEADGTTPAIPACPSGPLVGGLPDLDGNGSTADGVVHVVTPGGPVENLARAIGEATRTAAICTAGFATGSTCEQNDECGGTGVCTPTGRPAAALVIAALCTAGANAGRSCDLAADCPGGTCAAAWVAALVSEAAEATDLDDDGDMADSVVEVHRIGDGPTVWTNTHEAADRIGACGGRVVFITPESTQGADRNDDGDQSDRVLQLYDPATSTLTNTHQAAQEFVCNDAFVAFRTPEAEQDADLNADGDLRDRVIQVYDLASATVRNSGQPARPCTFDACDPRFPYRVAPGSVKFLTFECDTTGPDSVPGDDVCGFGTDLTNDGDPDDLVIQIYDLASGITHPIAEPFAGDPFLGGTNSEASDRGVVYLGSGRCLEPLGEVCATDTDCTAPGAHCQLDVEYDFCFSQDDCAADQTCVDSFCRTGFCTAGCESDTACPLGTECVGGICRRDQGVCATDLDCPPGIACRDEVTVPASPDTDGDSVPDHVDNCPYAANTAQTDTDGDHVGDACDLATCGNGVVEAPDETCDGLDAPACPGTCLPTCRCDTTTCTDMPSRPGLVLVNARHDRGRLRVALTLGLQTYAGEPVTVTLSDTDSDPIASTQIPTLEASRSGRSWRYKSKTPGLRRVVLRARTPGAFSLDVTAQRWFTAAAANRPAADTRVTVTVGSQCFTHVVTRKTD